MPYYDLYVHVPGDIPLSNRVLQQGKSRNRMKNEKLRLNHGLLQALLVLSFLVPVTAAAQEVPADTTKEFVPVYHPELTIRRAAGPIKLDGVLDDEGWKGAARAGNFAEHNPGDQTKPAVDTEVLVTFDDKNLYVAWICYDDPGEVRASFCERDRIFQDDYVMLMLDTYGEATLAYEIASNPLGIPGDLLFSSAHGEDHSFSMIFETRGKITEFGWVVEMEIPFRSLRFPNKEEQVWRIDFWRNRPREVRYQYSWAAYDRDVDCWPCKWGTMDGISGIDSGRGLELLPSVVAHQAGAIDENGMFQNKDPEAELGLGVKYDFTSEISAGVTINPDFSQVESDAAQIDVNTTFALFYPERRPFFQQGSDIFNTDINAVYTRSINDPSVAGKMIMRKGKNSLAFLSAYDEHSIIILPFEEESEYVANGKSWSNLLRYRGDLGEGSHLGLVLTDRRFDGGGSGSLAGVDGQIRLTQSNSIEFQLVGSHTDEINNPELTDSAFNEMTFDGGKYTAALDGEEFWGHAFSAELGRRTGSYWLQGGYEEKSPTFRADNGFEPQNNSRIGRAAIGGIKRFEESKILENINGNLHFGRKWNFDNVQKDEWANFSFEFKFRAAQTGIHSRVMASNERFGGIQFEDIWLAHTCFRTTPWEALTFGGHLDYGHRIARNYLVMGKETNYGAWADIKPINRLLVGLNYRHVFSDDLETGERLFSQSIFRLRADLQMSRRFSIRVITQYNDRYRSWDFDPLITYRVNSLSVFYVGSTYHYREYALSEGAVEDWRLSSRQYFLKFQYLFQL